MLAAPHGWAQAGGGFGGGSGGSGAASNPNPNPYPNPNPKPSPNPKPRCDKLIATVDSTRLNCVGNDFGTQYRHGLYPCTDAQELT